MRLPWMSPYLDLCRRYPQDEILPIALVDDDCPRDLTDTIQRGALGDTFLSFRTRIVQVPALDLERFRLTRNRVALSFLPNMRGDLDAVERVLHVTMAFQLQDDSEGLRKFFAFWVVEGRLLVAQQLDLNRRLKEMGNAGNHRMAAGRRPNGGPRRRRTPGPAGQCPQDARIRHRVGNRNRRDRHQTGRATATAIESDRSTPLTRRYQTHPPPRRITVQAGA